MVVFRFKWVLWVVGLVFVSPLQAGVIYSNLESGYTTTDPRRVGGVGGSVWDAAASFTPSGADFFLDQVELAVRLFGGPNEINVYLMSDQGGLPGTILETFPFSGAMSSVDPGSIISANSVAKPVLSAGTPYWLAASASVLTHAGWYQNLSGALGYAYQQDGGGWNSSTGATPAFRISGTPVPEASTLLLFGLGGLVVIAWHLRRKATLASQD
jgi:hypothetical protein